MISEGAKVWSRLRWRMGPRQEIHGTARDEEVRVLPEFEGNLRVWLEERSLRSSHSKAGSYEAVRQAEDFQSSVAESEDAEWWIDLNPEMKIGEDGADLFLDRSYKKAEVVVCGSFFCKDNTSEATHPLSGEWLRITVNGSTIHFYFDSQG